MGGGYRLFYNLLEPSSAIEKSTVYGAQQRDPSLDFIHVLFFNNAAWTVTIQSQVIEHFKSGSSREKGGRRRFSLFHHHRISCGLYFNKHDLPPTSSLLLPTWLKVSF